MKAIRDFSKSSSFSLSALFTALLMLGVFFIGYFVMFQSDNTLIRESEAAVTIDAQSLERIYTIGGIDALRESIANRLDNADLGGFYLLRNPSGQIVEGNLLEWPTTIDHVRSDGYVIYIINPSVDAQSERLSVLPFGESYNLLSHAIMLDNGFELLVGRNVDDIEVAQWVGNTFGWIIMVMLCAIAGISVWVGYYVVARINAMSETAQTIMDTGDLSARLPIDSTWDDLSKLAEALNRMLEEIERSVSNIQSVSDNIAHDLRTPLTRLRQRIENQVEPHTAQPLLAEADSLLSMFNGLLRIADIETDKQKSGFADYNAATIVDDVIELYQPLAEDKRIALTADISAVTSRCDRDLLFQCVANIVDNAIKFTPEAGAIHVYVGQSEDHAIIRVDDTGVGVAKERFVDITRRFFREDKSRSAKGNGLGMAMVAAITRLHNGKLVFTDNPLSSGSGLGVTVYLPTFR